MKILPRLLPVLLAVGLFFSCTQESGTSAVSALFPEPPDTVNLVKRVNFLNEEELNAIIDEPTVMSNGKIRPEGIIAFPQDGDDFRRADLDESYWRHVSSRESDFRGASFRTADCSEGDFSRSDFRASDMRWTFLDFSNLKHANFKQAKMFHVHASDAKFDSCDFRGANMFGMEAHYAKFRNCDFSNALMKDSELLGSDLTGSVGIKANMIRAVLTYAVLDSTDFCYADFTGAGLGEVTFVNARLIGANFQGSHLQGADFTGADLTGCNFFAAEMDSTVFSGAINIPKQVKEMMEEGVVTGVIQELQTTN